MNHEVWKRLVVSATAIGISFLGIPLCSSFSEANERPKIAEAALKDNQGKKVGTATFMETEAGVKVRLRASGLPPGSHGIHFHEKGRCEGPKFESAGKHFSPGEKEHGLKNPKGPHAGDLPNLNVKPDGSAVAEMVNKRVTLADGEHSLLRSGGISLVIHAKADDQKTNPSGDSGDRLACGVVTQSHRQR